MAGKTMSVLGAISAMAAVSAAGAGQAAPAQQTAVPAASSYAELLTPIPNAEERLRASDAELASRPAMLIEAQYSPGPVVVVHDHHHHHHYWRRHWRRRYYRHHHHHHAM